VARTYTAAEVDAAVARMLEPGSFDHASEVVTHAAPSLARVLDEALAAGGWFEGVHEEQLLGAAAAADEDRLAAVRSLVAEQTRLGMMVGVAVGFELARSLEAHQDQSTEGS
jgi:hypothetical protein